MIAEEKPRQSLFAANRYLAKTVPRALKQDGRPAEQEKGFRCHQMRQINAQNGIHA
jgi:hypothetical protein